MERAHQEPDQEGFSPRYWKRIAYVFLCMASSFSYNLCLGFSYGSTYGTYIRIYSFNFYRSNSIALTILFKLLQPFVEMGLVNLVGESLLAVPVLSVFIIIGHFLFLALLCHATNCGNGR